MAKRKDMMQLFTDDLNEIIKLDYSFSHALPLRTSREQPALTWGFAYVLGVDAESQWKDEAIAYIEACLTDPDPYDHVGRKLLPYVDGQPGTYKVYDRFETYTENWLRDLTNYEGHFVYAPIRTYEVYYKAIKQFMEGDLSAEKLAQKISVPKLDPNI